MYWFLKAIRQYADFNGRARRKEYWMFTLFVALFALILYIPLLIAMFNQWTGVATFLMVLYFLYSVGFFIPGLAVTVRRLHDVGKSGWFLFIGLIPIVGAFWLLILYLTDSMAGENEYGPNPKGIGNSSDLSELGATNIEY